MDSQYIDFSVFLNGKWQLISIYGKTLSMSGFVLNCKHNICSIALAEKKFFLVFTEKDPVTGANMLKDNISAYDYAGKHLYDINDIIPVSETYTCASICEITKEQVKEQYPCPGAIKGHHMLYCPTYFKNYCIDIEEDKLLAVLTMR